MKKKLIPILLLALFASTPVFAFSLTDFVADTAIYIYQETIFRVLPTNLPLIDYQTFSDGLFSVLNYIVPLIYFVDGLFPITLIFKLIALIISLELLLFIGRQLIFLYNLIRGSGAKI